MKKRILFVNDEMCVGGVSKVLNNLLSNIDLSKYEVELLILHYHGEMINDIPKSINVIKGSRFFELIDQPITELWDKKSIVKIMRKIYMFSLLKTGLIKNKIKKERQKMKLSKYDVEIAFKEGFCSVFVASGDATIKVNWIHADYKVMNYAKNYMNLMPKILSDFNEHVAVSMVAAISFQEVFNLNKKVKVIHNIIETENILSKANEDINYRDDFFSFISVGRLHPQKSYDRLVRASGELSKEGYKFRVYIIGDGEQKQMLEALIEKHQVENTVILLGNQPNPFKYLKQADCFVLSSIYEGLPTVVFESMILKVPVFALDVAGVAEQLQNKYGFITENTEKALVDGMKKILDDPAMLKQYRSNLSRYSYNNQKILEEIYELFEANHE